VVAPERRTETASSFVFPLYWVPPRVKLTSTLVPVDEPLGSTEKGGPSHAAHTTGIP
jgi:hypothetical protein